MIPARDHRDVVLVRGMVDVIFDTGSSLEILDYKTDALEAAACEERANLYLPQINGYAVAIEGICGQPVAHRWLVFLQGRQIVDCSGGRSSVV